MDPVSDLEQDARRYRLLRDYLLLNGFIRHVELPDVESEPFVTGVTKYRSASHQRPRVLARNRNEAANDVLLPIQLIYTRPDCESEDTVLALQCVEPATSLKVVLKF